MTNENEQKPNDKPKYDGKMDPELFFKLATQFGCIHNLYPDLFELIGTTLVRKEQVYNK